MILPLNVLRQLEDDAIHLGLDAAGADRWSSRLLPQQILDDLRFAGRGDGATLWESPTYQAVVAASPGEARLALFDEANAYEAARQNARRGTPPTHDRERDR